MASCSYPVIAMCLGVTLGLIASATSAFAEDVGQIKVAKGAVHLERGGQKLSAAVGARVRQADVIVTGPDGSDDMVKLGAPADQIQVAGRGEREPLAATEDEVAEPRNRRVEISVR